MAFDAEDTDLRGLTLLGPDGDLEITWEPQNDEKMRALIEKKMKEGVRFFVLKPVIGDVLHMRRKLTKLSELKAHNVKIKDADVEALFTAGEVGLFRTSQDKIETAGVVSARDSAGNVDHKAASKSAVRKRTVGVPALQGG